MADLVGSDIPTGDEVKWYYSGTAATFLIDRAYSLVGASVTKGIIALGNSAEHGLVWGELVRGATAWAVPIVEYGRNASDIDGVGTDTKCIKIPNCALGGDVLNIKYVNVGTTALTHIASCRDVKVSRSIDTKSISVQGQSNKLKKTSMADLTADLSEVTYSQTFLAALYGDQTTAAASQIKWSDITSGVKKLGAIIGKRIVSGTVVKKWALIGVQPSAFTENFPTEDYYTRDLSLVVDNVIIWDNE